MGRGNAFRGRLSDEQRLVLRRLERGEITAPQAERLLTGVPLMDEVEEAEEVRPDETPEEAQARLLVERIAQEVDAERRA